MNARSHHLLDRQHSILLVVDIQDRLLPQVRRSERIVWNTRRLLEAASLLQVAVRATEQYPEKLGATLAELLPLIPERRPKRMFSCRENAEWVIASDPSTTNSTRKRQLVLCGIESHVCVLQTAFDLLDICDVFVVADAVSSRSDNDHDLALERMRHAGINLVSTESVLFEWCENSQDKDFKAISALVRQVPPAEMPDV